MLFLPELCAGHGRWRLPVSGTSAFHLAEALLASDRPAGRRALRAALAAEPGFALWIVCRAAADLSSDPSPHDAVDWLLDHLGGLQWSARDEERSAGRHDTEVWASLAAATVRLAGPDGVQPETLGPLLVTAEQWLSYAAFDETSAYCSAEILPGWLSQRLARQGRREVPLTALDAGTLARWTQPACSVATLLPQLAETSGQVRRLREEFDASLEREKLAALREFAYGASHEINNPLANISTRAQTLLRDEGDPERRRRLATIASQAFRAHEMIADLMLFAKPPDLVPSEFILAALLEAVVAEVAGEAEEQGTLMELRLLWKGTVRADREQLGVACKALIRNALEALDSGGRVVVTCRSSPADAPAGEAGVLIEVEDTGPGIPRAARARLFDPFFSGREAGRGLGLGLSKCWRIVTLHGGSVVVDCAEPVGSRFTLRLPVERVACPSIRTAG